MVDWRIASFAVCGLADCLRQWTQPTSCPLTMTPTPTLYHHRREHSRLVMAALEADKLDLAESLYLQVGVGWGQDSFV